jgi:hypothetical protein
MDFGASARALSRDGGDLENLYFQDIITVPCVVACGYRYVRMPKTGLEFPAWLIRLPSSPDSDAGGNFCAWRSKRDLLVLFRAVGKATTTGNLKPPKAALNKLVENAPWKRNDMGEKGERSIGQRYLCCRNEDNSELPNNFQVAMKKSLRQMDHFLQTVHCQAALVVMGKDDNDHRFVDAWKEFCRPSHVVGLVELVELSDDGTSAYRIIKPPTTSIEASSKLGQYFCSQENAVQLVDLALDWIVREELEHVVVLEPSCGHGQIVWELLQEIEMGQKGCTAVKRIIGCDLDPHAVETCRAKAAMIQSHVLLEWIREDLLQSKMNSNIGDATVICLGGPPYTSGAGSGKEMSLSLPQLFLNHCLNEWNARFVAFVLPKRYKKYPLDLPLSWTCKTYEMESSIFYFRGKMPVTQPSMIQICRQSSTCNTQL